MANRKGKTVLTDRQKTIKAVKQKQKKQKQKKDKQKKQVKTTNNVSNKASQKSSQKKGSTTLPKLNLPQTTQKNATTFKPTVTNTSKQYSSFKNNVLDKKDKKEKKGYDSLADAVQAYNKGKNTTYLGTEQKETTTKLATDKQQKKIAKEQKEGYYKSKDWKEIKKEIKRQNRKGWKDYLVNDLGYSESYAKAWLQSDEGKKYRRETYLETKGNVKKAINKGMNDDVKKTYNLNSVNALTKDEFNRMVSASSLGKKAGNKALNSNERLGTEDIRYKVGSKTADSAYKSKFATGLMQGSGYADVFNGVGKYNKASKEAIRQTRDSGAYLAGYGVGMAGTMLGGGIASRGASAAELVGKGIAKKTGKEMSKSAGKTFARNRAGELITETPMNVLDAAKMSMDENGKVDKNELAKWLGVNTALTGAVGGAMEGIGGAITKKQTNRVAELFTKRNSGLATKEEKAELDKLIEKISKKADGGYDTMSKSFATESKQNVDDFVENAKDMRLEKGKAKGRKAKDRFAEQKWEKSQAEYDAQGRRISDREQAKSWENAQDEYSAFKTNADERVEEKIKYSNDLKEAKSLQKEASGIPENKDLYPVIDAKQKRVKDLQKLKEQPSVYGKRKNEIENEIATLEREITDLKSADSTKWMAYKSEQKYGDLTKNATVPASAIKTTDNVAEISVKSADNVAEGMSAQSVKAEAKNADNLYNKNGLGVPMSEQEIRYHKENHIRNKKGSEYKDSNPKFKDKTMNDLDKEFKKADIEGNEKLKDEIYAEMEHRSKLEDYDDYSINGGEVSQISGHERTSLSSANVKETTESTVKETTEKVTKDTGTDGYAEKIAELNKEKTELAKEHTRLKGVKEEIRNSDPNYKTNPEYQAAELKQRKLRAEDEAIDKKIAKYRKSYKEGRTLEEALDTAKKKSKPKETKRKGGANTQKEIKTAGKETDTLIDKTIRGWVNSFHNWDNFVSGIEDAGLRNKGFHLIQNVRMARGKAVARVFDEFTTLYKDAGLTKKGSAQKMKDFEEYCYLKHDLERLQDDTEFLGKSKEEIEARIEEIENKYHVVDEDGVISASPELLRFQRGVVDYFDRLLKEDVKCGFDTAENVAKLRAKYSNYVPTFRSVDEMGSHPSTHEIHFGTVYKAKGGTDQELKSLYDQAIDKTKLTTKRTALNDMVSFVAEINGVSARDLPKGFEPDELMRASTLPRKKGGDYYIHYWENGQAKELKISEGMYKGIAQWSGKDKLFFMEWKALNGKFVEATNRFFKNWITDYSLVFGARNFIRDITTGLFYSPHALSYAKNIPRAIGCVIADSKPMRMFADSVGSDALKMYVEESSILLNAYKKNGGQFSQLVTSTNPERLIRITNRKNPLGWIREVNSMFETVPRMAEFCSVAEKRAKDSVEDWNKLSFKDKKKALADTLDNKDVIDEAMYRAKEVTLNFDRSGYIGRWLNAGLVPFFNPSVQGLSKLGRTLSKKNKTAGEFTSMLAKFIVLGVGGEVAFQSLVGDNKDYQDISDYNKTAYYCLPMRWFDNDASKTDFIKIPKAREVAAIQGGIVWGFQHCKYHCAGKDEDLFRSLISIDKKGHIIPTVSGNAKIWYEQIGVVNPLADNLFFSPIRIGRNQTWYGGTIENSEEQELVKKGKSYMVKDENSSQLAIGLSKVLNNGYDKVLTPLLGEKTVTNLKRYTAWSPKKLDALMDSYLGTIYDLSIKQTSQKNHKLTDIVDSAKEGDLVGFGANSYKLLTSNWGNAFALDTVFSNRHKSDAYQRKTDIYHRMDKLTNVIDGYDDMDAKQKRRAVIKEYGYGSDEWKEYKKLNAEVTRLNNAYLYTSSQYDEMTATIYNNDKLSSKQKDYWAKQIKIEQNGLLDRRQEGKLLAGADPMKWAYTTKKKNGEKLFSVKQVLDMCTYTNDEGVNGTKDAYNKFIKTSKNVGKFMDTTLAIRDVNRRTGESLAWNSYTIGNYVIASKELKSGKSYRDVASAYGMTDAETDYIGDAKKYFTVGKGTLDTFVASHKTVVQGAIDLCKYESDLESWDKANILAKQMTSGKNGKKRKFLDRAYYAEGFFPLMTMNSARCLFSDKYKDSKWTPSKISEFCAENGFTYKKKDAEGNTIKPNADKVAKAIKSKYGQKCSQEECAALFNEICPYDTNPFGEVGDYSVKGDTGIQYDGYGYSRRGWHRYGHGGGGGGGTTKKGSSSTYKATKLKDVTFDSNLDDAYRKKLKKLREKTRD